jgi:hypothetical protein
MSDRFPPLRPQHPLTRRETRALQVPAPVDLTLLAALALVVALALV